MCGIFGLVRNIDAAHPERASAVFVELGRLAVERGSDSSGFAAVTATTGKVRPATWAQARSQEATLGGTTIIKAAASFTDLWDDTAHLPVLAGARVAIGHTRWATQGAKTAVNASPMAVGSLVGTHNGDVDTDTIPGHSLLTLASAGSTDSEVLFRAIDEERSHRGRIRDLLTKVEGRAALAWVDRTQQDRVYLARAALSPLAVAWDGEGNLYWASVPEWFRRVDTIFGGAIGFHDITIVREGTLLTVEYTDGVPVVADQRTFTPVVRRSDSYLSDAVVWRGFSAKDKAADKAQTVHTVSKRLSAGTFGSYKPAKVSYTPGSYTPADYAAAYGKGQASTTAPRWDELEPDPNLVNDADIVDSLDLGWDENPDECDEAEEAAIMWADQGYNPLVSAACAAADTRSPVQMLKLADDFGLSTTAVARAFVRAICAWAEELEREEAEQRANATVVVADGQDWSLVGADPATGQWDGPLNRVRLAPVPVSV